MSLRVASLGSGSQGNSFLIETDSTCVLVDAGFSGVQLEARVDALGVCPESVDAVIVSHEHQDHVRGIGVAARRWGWPLVMNTLTHSACSGLLSGKETVIRLPVEGMSVGDLLVEPTSTCHDAADPVCMVLQQVSTDLRVGVATDLGRPTTPVRAALKDLDFLIVEANHDDRMLRSGPYPWSVKERIGGTRGHLSNRHTRELVAEIAHRRLGGILLAHLSGECNDPLLAVDCVGEGLSGTGFDGVLAAAAQETSGEKYDVAALAARTGGTVQASLFPPGEPGGPTRA